jgi:hypothetical protein
MFGENISRKGEKIMITQAFFSERSVAALFFPFSF